MQGPPHHCAIPHKSITPCELWFPDVQQGSLLSTLILSCVVRVKMHFHGHYLLQSMRNCFTYYNPCLQLRKQSPRGSSETITVPHGVTRILTPKPSLSSVLLPSPFIKITVTPEMTLKGQALQRTLLPLTKGHHFTVVVVFKSLSRVPLYDPMDCSPPGSSVHGNIPGKNIEVGCPS